MEKLNADRKKEDPSKYYNRFLYKAVLVMIFMVILPLIPSQAPEFVNQTLLTRNWELLHLVFVGIAVSYGLFSRRNDEAEKENSSKFDNAQSVVSRLLQVSSFFEDEGESSSSSGGDENKVQTWSNLYHRNEPSVVVASQDSDFEKQREEKVKPLLLPVRSLKSRVSDTNNVQPVDKPSFNSVSLSGSDSKSDSRRFRSNSNKARNGELEKENVVLRSPFPWRSRSGRLETEQEVGTPTMEESEESRFIKSQTLRSSRQNSVPSSSKLTASPSLSSQKRLSPSSSLSSESLAKNSEDFVRKKGFYRSFPPPPPPPPPVFQKSISMKPMSSPFNEGDKELKRSFTSDRKDLKWNSGIEVKPIGKSVRTVTAGQIEDKEKSQLEAEHMSFKADKLMGHGSVPLVSEPVCMKFREEEKESFVDKVIVESEEETETEDDEVGESFVQKDIGESSKINGAESRCVSDDGPDVDKKADEFIARFREQIRLQRIESIKKSARIARNSARSS